MKIKTLLAAFLTWMATSLSAQNSYDILSFGAKGDGMTDDAAAIQKAIDRCSAEGGGVVLMPRNHVFLSGPVELKSNVELHLEATATLKANPNESIYKLSAFGENRGEGMLWLWAKDAENISITGKGTIPKSSPHTIIWVAWTNFGNLSFACSYQKWLCLCQ